MTNLLLFIAFAIALRFVLLLGNSLLRFNGNIPGLSDNAHGFPYTKSYDFWSLLSSALPFKSSTKHPFSIDPKKMQVIAKKNLCLRNSSRTQWFEAVKAMPYQIPFFTLTSDQDVVNQVQEGSSLVDAHSGSGSSLGLEIANYLRLQGRSVEKSFDDLCEDIRNRQIFQYIGYSNYDLLLNQYDCSPLIDDFGRYAGGGRVHTTFNAKSLVFRATLTKNDYAFIHEQSRALTANLLQSSTTRLNYLQRDRVYSPGGAHGFFNASANHSREFSQRIELSLATEIIWAKLANFINLAEFTEDYQPNIDQHETPAAFSDADSADLSTGDCAKLAIYAPNSKWFLELKSAVRDGCIPGGRTLPSKFN